MALNQGGVSPKLVLVGLICAVLAFRGKVKLAVTIAIGYFVIAQVFQMVFGDDDPTAVVGAGQEEDAVARVQAVVPQASEEDIRAELRRTRSVDATVANLAGRRGASPAGVPGAGRGAPKGRHRTVSFQSKKDSIFDKYRERYVDKFGDRVKRNQDLKAGGRELELDAALRQCRKPAGAHR